MPVKFENEEEYNEMLKKAGRKPESEPKIPPKSIEDRYREAKEKVGEKYAIVKSDVKQIAGLEPREQLKKSILLKAATKLDEFEENLKRKSAERKAKRESEAKEAVDIQKRLKSAYIQGREQHAYYKGYGGRVSKAKYERLAAKERRAEEIHQLKMKKGIGGFSVAKKQTSRPEQRQVARQTQRNPFGLTESGVVSSGRQPEQRRQIQRVVREENAADVLGLREFGTVAPKITHIERKIVRQTNTSNPFGNFNFGVGANPVGNTVVAKKGKKTQSNLGVEGYF